ncbi:sugar kinase [Streptomyces sp. SBST2-5]|uniref:Sugar kinase n=1 Tax=Streptomyces composti TaxID=2720025 RepID=A0ABX1A537_9ACTN|nr:sugar kinase [Streptomyces composti]NJP50177.1 sugar kinase [Streptomyces composti]
MTSDLPRQSGAPERPRPPEDRRHMIRRRALTLLIIVLLIGIPAGYLVISANQSRASGKDKEAKYASTGLAEGWPSKVQRRIYEVPIPHPAWWVAYYETNNWKTSRLYVEFETTDAGLDAFLTGMGLTKADLNRGDVTIGERDRRITGWRFDGPGTWSGLVHKQKNPKPTREVMVNHNKPGYPRVYVVSRTVP